jgi:hypothetical protein
VCETPGEGFKIQPALTLAPPFRNHTDTFSFTPVPTLFSASWDRLCVAWRETGGSSAAAPVTRHARAKTSRVRWCSRTLADLADRSLFSHLVRKPHAARGTARAARFPAALITANRREWPRVDITSEQHCVADGSFTDSESDSIILPERGGSHRCTRRRTRAHALSGHRAADVDGHLHGAGAAR